MKTYENCMKTEVKSNPNTVSQYCLCSLFCLQFWPSMQLQKDSSAVWSPDNGWRISQPAVCHPQIDLLKKDRFGSPKYQAPGWKAARERKLEVSGGLCDNTWPWPWGLPTHSCQTSTCHSYLDKQERDMCQTWMNALCLYVFMGLWMYDNCRIDAATAAFWEAHRPASLTSKAGRHRQTTLQHTPQSGQTNTFRAPLGAPNRDWTNKITISQSVVHMDTQ